MPQQKHLLMIVLPPVRCCAMCLTYLHMFPWELLAYPLPVCSVVAPTFAEATQRVQGSCFGQCSLFSTNLPQLQLEAVGWSP